MDDLDGKIAALQECIKECRTNLKIANSDEAKSKIEKLMIDAQQTRNILLRQKYSSSVPYGQWNNIFMTLLLLSDLYFQYNNRCEGYNQGDEPKQEENNVTTNSNLRETGVATNSILQENMFCNRKANEQLQRITKRFAG